MRSTLLHAAAACLPPKFGFTQPAPRDLSVAAAAHGYAAILSHCGDNAPSHSLALAHDNSRHRC